MEEIHILRHTIGEDVIHLDVINSGPDPVSIAQVMVRGAFWHHDVTPSRTVEPLRTARVTIPFPWNLGEPARTESPPQPGVIVTCEWMLTTPGISHPMVDPRSVEPSRLSSIATQLSPSRTHTGAL